MPAEQNPRTARTLKRTADACLQAVDAVASGGVGQPVLARLLVVLTDAVQSLGVPGRGRALGLPALMAARERQSAEMARIAGRADAEAGSAGLGGQLAAVREALSRMLGTPPAVVQAVAGPVETADLLAAVTIEACALGLAAGVEMPRPSLIAASRGLAGVLGERFGGRTIEMRVPPATAVQLEAFGQGPNHHRGTPPNVAETDPATFVRLATGLAGWQEVRAAGLIQASGSHVDAMSRMLPVVDLW